TGHLLPDEVHQFRQFRAGHAAHRKDVRIGWGPRPSPSTAQHLMFELHTYRPLARRLDNEDVGSTDGESGEEFVQTHRNAPSRQAQATATSRAPRKRNISTTAESPFSITTTAQEYMNSSSTSEARKMMDPRYQRTSKRDRACSWGPLPDWAGNEGNGSTITVKKRCAANSATMVSIATKAMATIPYYFTI